MSKTGWIVGALLILIGGMIAGAAVGIWFTTHYRIVPIDQAPNTQAMLGTQPPAPTFAGPSPVQAASPSVSPSPAEPAPASYEEGPFRFRFTPGERLTYQLEAHVDGLGSEAEQTSGISLDIGGAMGLDTQSVDASGVATMELAFDQVAMTGDFMGTPVEMSQNGSDSYYAQDGRAQIDTAQGIGGIQGIPQFEFFEKPIGMQIAPNGEVQKLWGGQDIASMLAVVPTLSTLEFPSAQMQEGRQWESHIALPVPGFGDAANARLLNTFMGYQYVGDRVCAVIEQEFLSTQHDGTLNSPESALGESMLFSMPLFELKGKNVLYFDVNAGQLAHCDMDLNLVFTIGQMLNGSVGLLSAMSESILSGDEAALDRMLSGETDNLLDMGVGIKGRLTLAGVDRTQAQ